MDADKWNDRYLDAELVWSKGPNAFVEEGSVTIYTEPPPDEARPVYEPL